MAVITLYCDGILCDSELNLEVPEWSGEPDFGDDGRWLFCPKCKKRHDWFGAVCPGCVESYPECSLSRAFAYDNSSGLTETQKQAIVSGRCPFRTNGTFGFGPPYQNIETFDLSEIAPDGSGEAIIDAVERYCKEFGIPKRN